MFEEVKEMIDSTIYTNGRGEVTAQNVNLAMQAIVDATEDKLVSLEENGFDSSGALKVWVWDEALGVVPTEEQIAENIATYNKLMEGNHSSVILCVDEILPDGLKSTVSINVDAQAIDSVGEPYVVLQGAQPKMPNSNDMQTVTIQLNADGTMVFLYGEDSAPSGPAIVYMGLMEEIGEGLTLSLTEGEKAHNAEVFKVIKDAKGQIAVSIDGARLNKQSLEDNGIDLTDDMFALLPVIMLMYLPVIAGFNDVEAIRLATGEFLLSLHPDGTLTVVL